jgi:hypothetical protein
MSFWETTAVLSQNHTEHHYTAFCSPSLSYLLVHSRCRGFLFSLDHTQTHTTVGRTPLDEGAARRRDLYLTTQTLYKRQTSTPPVAFEPTLSASARLQTYALDRAATGIGNIIIQRDQNSECLHVTAGTTYSHSQVSNVKHRHV